MKNGDGSASGASMRLASRHDLPFTTVTLCYGTQEIDVPWILVDTGSATTVLSADHAAEVGIQPAADDRIRTLRGVGGTETVFTRTVSSLRVRDTGIDDFDLEIGGMDYGFEINGVLGMNFLKRTGAVIDLRTMTMTFDDSSTV